MSLSQQHRAEVRSGQRFEFGANWTRFLELVNEERIGEAERSLREMLGVDDLRDRSFLDVGSGSGLFSLAARRLGAAVVSFDFDPKSVACTEELRHRYFPSDPLWRVFEGSILEAEVLASLGTFDVVYSWGVLHHTGGMWAAIENAARLVKPDGLLFIAIYNHQIYWSKFYAEVKRLYVRTPSVLRWVIAGPYVAVQIGKGCLKDVLLLRNPWTRYREKIRARGMSMWYDWIDWIGGYPFEVAKPEAVFSFVQARGFELQRLVTCGSGQGCNEFVFKRRHEASASPRAVRSAASASRA